MSVSLNRLTKKLNYKFRDESLLKAALTHRSVRGMNNERLEFLGDAVVNFIIAEALYYLYPKAKEGELSRLRATLVKGETLAILAREFELGEHLRLGVGELKSGGARRESILADALEAVIAAIYLDGGFEVCRERVLKWYDERLKLVFAGGGELKDPKTCLQEYLQAQKLPLPVYSIRAIEGEAHAQTFFVECQVPGLPHLAVGEGTSRRKAEQVSAKQYLELLASTHA